MMNKLIALILSATLAACAAVSDGQTIQVYKLDGGSFVCEMSASSSFGDMAETQVYDKK